MQPEYWIPCDGKNDWAGECSWSHLKFPDGGTGQGSWEFDEDLVTEENDGWLDCFTWKFMEEEEWWTTWNPQPIHFHVFTTEENDAAYLKWKETGVCD